MVGCWKRKGWILGCLALCWALGAPAAWADQELIIDLRDENGGTIAKAEGILRLPDGSTQTGERLADGRFVFHVDGPKASIEFAGSDFIRTFEMYLPADPVVERTVSLARETGEDPPPGGGPANDLCEDAIPVAIPSVTAGSTLGSTIDNTFPICGINAQITTGGVWYSVIGTGTTITASTCNAANYDTKINVYCGRHDHHGIDVQRRQLRHEDQRLLRIVRGADLCHRAR